MLHPGTGHGAALLLLAAGCAATGVPRTASDDPSLASREVGHVKLHVRTSGDPNNPPVLVLHGGPGGDHRCLLPLEALADRYHVVFYDQRGSGLSERVGEDRLKLADFYAELDAVVDHFGRGRTVSLIGHSWGAMLASGYVGQHPEKVDHVVLAEPGMVSVETGRILMAATNRMRPAVSFDLIRVGTRVWFESLDVDGPDEEARRDYRANALMAARVAGHRMAPGSSRRARATPSSSRSSTPTRASCWTATRLAQTSSPRSASPSRSSSQACVRRSRRWLAGSGRAGGRCSDQYSGKLQDLLTIATRLKQSNSYLSKIITLKLQMP